MFKHILFPTDTSPASNAGFDVALDLQRRYGGRITLLNVHEEFLDKCEMHYLRVSQAEFSRMIREHALESRKILEELIREAGAEDFCSILLREGKPRQTIICVAEEIDADLIVMSSFGRTNIAEQLIGSVAEYIVRHATIPVLVVRRKKK